MAPETDLGVELVGLRTTVSIRSIEDAEVAGLGAGVRAIGCHVGPTSRDGNNVTKFAHVGLTLICATAAFGPSGCVKWITDQTL